MKKIILFLLTVALALGGLGFAHAAVTDARTSCWSIPPFSSGTRRSLRG